MGARNTRLLDVTRLLRRAGRLPTGVDRVELAYLRHLLAMSDPIWGLARTHLGYVLLDRKGLAEVLARIEGRVPWGPVDRLSGMFTRMGRVRRQAESDLRRLSTARCLPQGLGRMLGRYLPPGGRYLNVGHSNLTDRVLSTVRHRGRLGVSVMIHDTIPLDFPQYQRDGSDAAFRAMLRRVRAHADLVICNSEQTRLDLQRHMVQWGAVPDSVVAHLGIDPPAVPEPVLVTGFDPDTPYFITVGTIEPRKNHAFLMRIWQDMAGDDPCPQLLICGHRGWKNEDLFALLDTSPLMGRHVFELPGLTDGQITTLSQGASGLLFPSLAEGYGLPPIEATAQGLPVICNDLPVYREILGDIPVYVGIEDRYLWTQTIRGAMHSKGADGRQDAAKQFAPPTWQAHFNTVLSLT